MKVNLKTVQYKQNALNTLKKVYKTKHKSTNECCLGNSWKSKLPTTYYNFNNYSIINYQAPISSIRLRHYLINEFVVQQEGINVFNNYIGNPCTISIGAIKHNIRKVEWYAKDGIVIQINTV